VNFDTVPICKKWRGMLQIRRQKCEPEAVCIRLYLSVWRVLLVILREVCFQYSVFSQLLHVLHLRCCGMSCSVDIWSVTDVSGQPLGLIFKYQAVQQRIMQIPNILIYYQLNKFSSFQCLSFRCCTIPNKSSHCLTVTLLRVSVHSPSAGCHLKDKHILIVHVSIYSVT
jgi:hypothetical protein